MKLSTEEIARRMGEIQRQLTDLSQELKGLEIQLLMAVDRDKRAQETRAWAKKLP